MPGAASKRPGKGSAVQFTNTTNNPVIDWNVDEQGENIDTTALDDYSSSSQTLNKTSRIGAQYCSGHLAMIWDANRSLFNSPPGFVVDDLLGPLKIYINVADNEFWNFPVITINSVKVKGGTKGAVMFDVDWESSGPYTRPS